ncbi:MAG: cyclodeaminase/cyclohydrolase family protein [Candidatus Omnitrophica bacterium]|nr:cyclodeaminase/cyclohydrolase family protein [Candidatus Omnitrophota bacterium]
MTQYSSSTLAQYLDRLAAREPVPGGGSAAALSAALGSSLIAMVCGYSLGKGKPLSVEKKINDILAQSTQARLKFLNWVTLDARAYLNVIKTKKSDKFSYKKALKEAAAIPRDLRTLARSQLKMTSYLYKEGNPYLLSDVKAAEEFLKAAINTANIMIETNQ